MIGGFGSLNGQIDFWDLNTLKEIGGTKSEMGIGLDWSPDGLVFMTTVLYELVKVDNDIKFFTPAGTAILKSPKAFEVLNSA